MRKVSIIGAGNVGATAAMKIAMNVVCDEIVLLDIKDGVAEGKAMDIMQCSMADCFNMKVVGVTNDYSATANSDVIVVTSGMARKPGMTREDLVGVNSRIMNSVIRECDKYSHNACYVIVSNPMDTMTMQALNILRELHQNQIMDGCVIGMGNLLDSSRFKYFIWKALERKGYNIPMSSIRNAWVIGGHGDKTMIPITEDVDIALENTVTSYSKLTDIFTEEEISDIVENTMKGGSILTNLLGTSAWEAPAACIAMTVAAILSGNRSPIPCSIYRKEYGCCIGTMVSLGSAYSHYGVAGIYVEDRPEIVEKLKITAEAIKEVNSAIPKDLDNEN